MKKLIILLAAVTLLASCGTSGNINTIDKSKLLTVKVGSTTKGEVLNTFGNFSEIQYLNSEVVVITYYFLMDGFLSYKTHRLDFKIKNNVVIDVNYSDAYNASLGFR